uniref:Secreted protein n=1 Tax=Steinernema glaseri TaxID=37863 RepID=A0A1I8AQH6_9BILA
MAHRLTYWLSCFLSLLSTHFANGVYFNHPRPNHTLIVLSAPSVWDENLREDFDALINFQLDFARTIHEHENVIILADRHTMPLLNGRSQASKQRMPMDALIETNIYDVKLRDFAPFGVRQSVKFSYRTVSVADMAAKQIDESIRRFLDDVEVKVDKKENEMVLSGEYVVDNGVNKAIVDQKVLTANHGRIPDWAVMIKLFNAFKKVVIVSNPMNGTDLRLDDVIGFVDDQIVVIPTLPKEVRAQLDADLYKKFRDEVMLVDLPVTEPDEGNCGMYTALLTTDKFVYVPVFGNDPLNWEQGYSTMTDKMVIHLVEANTRKTVVPVNIPRSICRRGYSLRSLSWVARGSMAEQLIGTARDNARFS